jgi:hypothetical protein
MNLPEYLFRGDQDRYNVRKLKSTLGNGLMMTNLCNGGSGRDIFNQPLKQSVNRHVSIGWGKTHFLSFSEDKNIAMYYACNDKECEETYEIKDDWDFALMTFETSRLTNMKQVDKGIYQAEFAPTCYEFLPSFKIFLIDIVTHLKALINLDIDLTAAILNAERDREWLILPAFPFGNGEFSSKLDTNCISETQVFKFV